MTVQVGLWVVAFLYLAISIGAIVNLALRSGSRHRRG
jgi:hypothetical protein